MEDWKNEIIYSLLQNVKEDRETFRDHDNDIENVRQGVERWLTMSAVKEEDVDGDVNATCACANSSSCLNSDI